MTDEKQKRKFTVISNPILDDTDLADSDEKVINEKYKKRKVQAYQTNPLREQFMRFTNEEAGRRFTVEDLLKW